MDRMCTATNVEEALAGEDCSAPWARHLWLRLHAQALQQEQGSVLRNSPGRAADPIASGLHANGGRGVSEVREDALLPKGLLRLDHGPWELQGGVGGLRRKHAREERGWEVPLRLHCLL